MNRIKLNYLNSLTGLNRNSSKTISIIKVKYYNRLMAVSSNHIFALKDDDNNTWSYISSDRLRDNLQFSDIIKYFHDQGTIINSLETR